MVIRKIRKSKKTEVKLPTKTIKWKAVFHSRYKTFKIERNRVDSPAYKKYTIYYASSNKYPEHFNDKTISGLKKQIDTYIKKQNK
jgi:hypothetical protein